jgi:hypothetical protein
VKLDPANHKTVLELQAEALAAREETAPEPVKKDAKGKGKQKAAPVPVSHDDDDDNDDAEDDAAMDVDADAAFDDAAASGSGSDADDDADDVAAPDTSTPLVPMAPASDVAALRAKLHARMASLRRGGPRAWPAAGREPASRDELLDERRLQRAEMRERRRRETREKVRAQEEARGKGKSKGKEEAREAAKKGNASQVRRSTVLRDERDSKALHITGATSCSRRFYKTGRTCQVDQRRLLHSQDRRPVVFEASALQVPRDFIESGAGTSAATGEAGTARGAARGEARSG